MSSSRLFFCSLQDIANKNKLHDVFYSIPIKPTQRNATKLIYNNHISLLSEEQLWTSDPTQDKAILSQHRFLLASSHQTGTAALSHNEISNREPLLEAQKHVYFIYKKNLFTTIHS